MIQSILRTFRLIFDQIGKVVNAVGNAIKWFHRFVSGVIQVAMNLSALAFVLFAPYAFAVDPLGWSSYLGDIFPSQMVFWGRIILAGFFLVVACFSVGAVWKSIWAKNPAAEAGEKGKKDLVRKIADALSWAAIAIVFAYFTVFRLELFRDFINDSDVDDIFGIL